MRDAASLSPGDKRLTIGQLFEFLAPSIWKENSFLCWPPDVFALAATLLKHSGAYTVVVSDWPPPPYKRAPLKWVTFIRRIAKEWRGNCVSGADPPSEIREWWRHVISSVDLQLSGVSNNTEFCHLLLQLNAAADEASAGAGIPPLGDDFETLAWACLQKNASLCRSVHPSRVNVLPKLHTPQSGMTVRSLSHHLALCSATDVNPSWIFVPTTIVKESLNLLLLPWPTTVTPRQFSESRPFGKKSLAMPKDFKFFDYDLTANSSDIVEGVVKTYDRAKKVVGRIDGVICPELCVPKDKLTDLRKEILNRQSFLVCGVGGVRKGKEEVWGENYVHISVPVSPGHSADLTQNKHHRWRLDKDQIVQYGLGANLDPMLHWWEHIGVGNRRLHFMAMRPWLTLCVLVCEDLARQDPLADMLRAVGPNLVIAILMDGPQLASRWPARYATVLADDPGSSVLTLTSVGMAELCRPPQFQAKSRVVAMWKDERTGAPVQIELPKESDALVLSLAVESLEEWTADGRSDQKTTRYPILTGIHPLGR